MIMTGSIVRSSGLDKVSIPTGCMLAATMRDF